MAVPPPSGSEVESVGTHLEFLVEEPSMEGFLRVALPRMIPECCSFRIHAFRSKQDLLRKLRGRLRGYQHWIPPNWRIVVLVDRDDQDCHALKADLEAAADAASLPARSQTASGLWRIANRIVIEELEAWYFGDWQAVRQAYPRVSANIPRRAGYRDPDAIRGGTWEAFERVMKRYGYFTTGLRKVEAAESIAAHIDPDRNTSRSFDAFRSALVEATGELAEQFGRKHPP